MDALTHAVEAYLSRFYNTKQTRLLAEHAVVTIFTHLERAYRDGTSLPDRAAMLQASLDAGAAFTRASVGNVHAIAHTLRGLYGVSHGLAMRCFSLSCSKTTAKRPVRALPVLLHLSASRARAKNLSPRRLLPKSAR